MGALGTTETITVEEAFARRGWTEADVKRKLRNERARLRYTPTIPHSDYTLRGGPLDGAVVSLSFPSTAPITVRDQAGRYVPITVLRGICLPKTGLSAPPIVMHAEAIDREYRDLKGYGKYTDTALLYWLPETYERKEA